MPPKRAWGNLWTHYGSLKVVARTVELWKISRNVCYITISSWTNSDYNLHALGKHICVIDNCLMFSFKQGIISKCTEVRYYPGLGFGILSFKFTSLMKSHFLMRVLAYSVVWGKVGGSTIIYKLTWVPKKDVSYKSSKPITVVQKLSFGLNQENPDSY